MTTMNHHDADAKGRNRTQNQQTPMHHLPPVVPTRRPDGARQRAFNTPACGAALRKKTQAEWRRRNPEYAAAWRIDQRAKQPDPPAKPLRIPAPLDQLPWDLAKDEFGPQAVDLIALTCTLISVRNGRLRWGP